ncbi:glycosyltransferase [Pseudonocardiaceae bacterium YIM PH 21723]|nr:glycosyltransferase [Pseudonocardiaceae bacterium YIM PH 21723]
MRCDVPVLNVLGVDVAKLDRAGALEQAGRLLDADGAALLAYVNAHSLNLAYTDERYRTVLRDADLVLNDGSGLSLAAKAQQTTFPENLNGTDFSPAILELAAERGLSVYLLGGRPGIAQEAGDRLSARISGLKVAGSRDGFFTAGESAAVAEDIKASGAAVLLVGMGNPRQELWLAEHLAATGVRLGVAVGAFLDFSAGNVPRAPQWMRGAGIEWIYRLGREPRRLARRYLVGNPLFVYRVLGEQRRRRHA